MCGCNSAQADREVRINRDLGSPYGVDCDHPNREMVNVFSLQREKYYQLANFMETAIGIAQRKRLSSGLTAEEKKPIKAALRKAIDSL